MPEEKQDTPQDKTSKHDDVRKQEQSQCECENKHCECGESCNCSEQCDCDAIKEQTLRLAAEFDNYKKRVKGELDNAKGVGKADLIKNMLPIIDEFEFALIVLSKTEDNNVAKGIEMLYSNFIDVLKKEGLAEIECKGVFDPYKHEPIMTKESEAKHGTILEVVNKGYTFNGTMLRPASVIVAKSGEKVEVILDDAEEKK
jgi:molecular chaperone GrpE